MVSTCFQLFSQEDFLWAGWFTFSIVCFPGLTHLSSYPWEKPTKQDLTAAESPHGNITYSNRTRKLGLIWCKKANKLNAQITPTSSLSYRLFRELQTTYEWLGTTSISRTHKEGAIRHITWTGIRSSSDVPHQWSILVHHLHSNSPLLNYASDKLPSSRWVQNFKLSVHLWNTNTQIHSPGFMIVTHKTILLAKHSATSFTSYFTNVSMF